MSILLPLIRKENRLDRSNFRISALLKRKFSRAHRTIFGLSILLMTGSSFAQAYKFNVLGNGIPLAINSAGKVVGYTQLEGNSIHATLWANGAATDLGTSFLQPSFAYGINDSDQISGYVQGSIAIRWINTLPQAATPLGGYGAVGYGINNSGQMTGYSQVSCDNFGGACQRAVLWNGDNPTNLAPTNPYGSGDFYNAGGHAINDSGMVVGWAQSAGSNIRKAAMWNAAGIQLLGNIGGNLNAGSDAYDVNNAGQIVGASFNCCGLARATLWEMGSVYDLGTMPGKDSNAYGINNSGIIVGSSGSSAVIWVHKKLIDLNTLLDAQTLAAGWTLTDARAINDSGSIVGVASNSYTYERVAYILAVPEPSTYLLFSLGAIVVFIFRRRAA